MFFCWSGSSSNYTALAIIIPFARNQTLAAMVVLPEVIWISVLFVTGDLPSRMALRATTSAVNRAGSMALATVQARLQVLNGYPSRFPDIYIRMSWWTPWVGYRNILRPPNGADPVCAALWLELERVPFGRNITGIPWLDDAIELHGSSSAGILWQEFVVGRGWVSRHTLWEEANI